MLDYIVTDAEHGIRLDKWCKLHLPHLPFGLLQKSMRTGMIKLNGRKTDHAQTVCSGDIVGVANSLTIAKSPDPNKSSKQATFAQAAEIKQWVIFEDAHCIALNKPAGIAVQGGTGLDDSIDLRLDGLRAKDAERPKLTHRIDRDTSGLLLLAKSRADAAIFTEAFRDKTARKLYWALVVGEPNEPFFSVNLPLGKRNLRGGLEKMSVVVDDNGDEALTHFRVITYNSTHNISWIEAMPVTGRTHQIRVHLQAIGHPIYGDGKYGGKQSFNAKSFNSKLGLSPQLHLHARYLQLLHPRKYEFTAPAPEYFMASLSALGWSLKDDNSASLLDL